MKDNFGTFAHYILKTKDFYSMTPEEFFKNDLFALHTGIELLEVSKGYSKTKMRIMPHHLNAGGRTQGGAIRLT